MSRAIDFADYNAVTNFHTHARPLPARIIENRPAHKRTYMIMRDVIILTIWPRIIIYEAMPSVAVAMEKYFFPPNPNTRTRQ